MLTCAVLATLAVSAFAEIPPLAAEVENDARALSAQTELTPAFFTQLEDFSQDSMRLSNALRAAGVTQDLPCIFRGISEDAHDRAADLSRASTTDAQAVAFSGLHALLDDAILLAPMAAGAAADAAAEDAN